MNNLNEPGRTLAYMTAKVIREDELKEICGGVATGTGTTSYTTKESADNHGNWDVGGDIRWD